jgi:hypothetical protein
LRLLRASLRLVFLSALAWAAVVTATGGFQLRIGALRISSREPGNALLVALAALGALMAVARLAAPNGLSREWAWWRRAARDVFVWPRAHAHEIPGEARPTVPFVLAPEL